MGTTTITAEPGSHEATIDREFAASPELLFRAHNDPDLLAQWLGPRGYTMKVETFEPRFGGVYRFTHITPDGTEHKFRGVFLNDPSVEDGIVRTFEYLGAPGHISLETVRFVATATGTIAHASAVHQSVEARDAMLASGMETGVVEGYEQLDELLVRLG